MQQEQRDGQVRGCTVLPWEAQAAEVHPHPHLLATTLCYAHHLVAGLHRVYRGSHFLDVIK